MTQDQQRRAAALWVTSRGRLTEDDCIEIVTEADYQRLQRQHCDPPWTGWAFCIAIVVVYVIAKAVGVDA